MCLIIHKKANVTFEDHELRAFYNRNDDGYGFLHSEEGRLHVHKSLGNAEAFIRAFRAREDKECLIHLRFRTHGEVDMLNTHPYEVLTREEGGEYGPVWMMHNGILAHGNDSDKKFSDTWHYIKNYLKPILAAHPDLLFNESFQCLVRNDIGKSNKFAFMTARGDVVILNRESGDEHKGAWVSNKHSWTTYSGYSGYQGGTYQGGKYQRGPYQGANWPHNSGGQRSMYSEYSDSEWEGMGSPPAPKVTAPQTPTTPENPTPQTPTTPENSTPQTPTTTASPAGGNNQSARVYADMASNFFALLKTHGFNEAYMELSLAEVELAFTESEKQMLDLIADIEKKDFAHSDDEGFIAAYVRDLAGTNVGAPDSPDLTQIVH